MKQIDSACSCLLFLPVLRARDVSAFPGQLMCCTFGFAPRTALSCRGIFFFFHFTGLLGKSCLYKGDREGKKYGCEKIRKLRRRKKPKKRNECLFCSVFAFGLSEEAKFFFSSASRRSCYELLSEGFSPVCLSTCSSVRSFAFGSQSLC